MFNPVSITLGKVNASKKKLNILGHPTHEGFETLLDKTGHNFFMLTGEGIKPWDFHTKPLPPNHYLLQKPQPMPNGTEIDLLLAQERNGGLQRMLELKQRSYIPVLEITHTMPPPGINDKLLNKISEIKPDKRVFITEFSKNAWGGSDKDRVIYHGLDPNEFTGWSGLSFNNGIMVCNHLQSRDVFCGWTEFQEVAREVPIMLVGENPGISKSAESTADLIKKLANSRYYLNTSKWSPIPLSLVEAAMIGLPIITTSHQEIAKFFVHEENCLIANTAEEMIKAARRLMVDDSLCERLGSAARQMALQHFHIDRFIKEWNEVILETYEQGKKAYGHN